MRYRTAMRLVSLLLLSLVLLQVAAGVPRRSQIRHPDADKSIDWSSAMVESTMRRYSTAEDLGSWGYAKSLYLYGQYLVWKRTQDPKQLQYIKDWIDSHVDANGVVTNTNAEGKTSEITFDNLDSMLPGNLLLLLYQETKDPKYKLAAERIRKRFDTYPRTTDGGFWHATSNSREWQL